MKNKNKTVHFSETVTVILIPYEERKGEWMTMALDRYRFKRRIENASNIISPVLEKHLQIIVRNYTTLDDDSQRQHPNLISELTVKEESAVKEESTVKEQSTVKEESTVNDVIPLITHTT